MVYMHPLRKDQRVHEVVLISRFLSSARSCSLFLRGLSLTCRGSILDSESSARDASVRSGVTLVAGRSGTGSCVCLGAIVLGHNTIL